HYAAGLVFLPTAEAEAAAAQAAAHRIAADEGLAVLGWRKVPHDPAFCGRGALATMPGLAQLVVAQAGAAPGAAPAGGETPGRPASAGPAGVLPAQALGARGGHVPGKPVVGHDRVQGDAHRAPARAVLPRPHRPRVRVGPCHGALPVLHQHAAVLAARASLPV